MLKGGSWWWQSWIPYPDHTAHKPQSWKGPKYNERPAFSRTIQGLTQHTTQADPKSLSHFPHSASWVARGCPWQSGCQGLGALQGGAGGRGSQKCSHNTGSSESGTGRMGWHSQEGIHESSVLWWMRMVTLSLFLPNTKKKIQASVILLRPLLSSNLGWTVTFGLPWAPQEPWGQLAQAKQRPLLSGWIHRRLIFSAAFPHCRPSQLTPCTAKALGQLLPMLQVLFLPDQQASPAWRCFQWHQLHPGKNLSEKPFWLKSKIIPN